MCEPATREGVLSRFLWKSVKAYSPEKSLKEKPGIS